MQVSLALHLQSRATLRERLLPHKALPSPRRHPSLQSGMPEASGARAGLSAMALPLLTLVTGRSMVQMLHTVAAPRRVPALSLLLSWACHLCAGVASNSPCAQAVSVPHLSTTSSMTMRISDRHSLTQSVHSSEPHSRSADTCHTTMQARPPPPPPVLRPSSPPLRPHLRACLIALLHTMVYFRNDPLLFQCARLLS